MKNHHFENCNAPLCSKGTEQEKSIWYIGEEICRLNSPFKKKQVEFNKKLKKGYKLDLERPYTIKELV